MSLPATIYVQETGETNAATKESQLVLNRTAAGSLNRPFKNAGEVVGVYELVKTVKVTVGEPAVSVVDLPANTATAKAAAEPNSPTDAQS